MGIKQSKNEISIQFSKQLELTYVTAISCGRQYRMEDRHINARINEKIFISAVIDGHWGCEIAEIIQNILCQQLSNNEKIQTGELKLGLQQVLQSLDSIIIKQHIKINQIRKKYNQPQLKYEQLTSAGANIVITLIQNDDIIIANIGSCKCYVVYKKVLNQAILFSKNHNESSLEDQNRVIKAGGFFIQGRVNGILPFTRSLGDFYFKNNNSLKSQEQILISKPSCFSLNVNDIKLIVMGSTAVWHHAQQVIQELQTNLLTHQIQKKTYQIVESILKTNKSQFVQSNITLTILQLQ